MSNEINVHVNNIVCQPFTTMRTCNTRLTFDPSSEFQLTNIISQYEVDKYEQYYNILNAKSRSCYKFRNFKYFIYTCTYCVSKSLS